MYRDASIPAAAGDAFHKRDRVFIVANSNISNDSKQSNETRQVFKRSRWARVGGVDRGIHKSGVGGVANGISGKLADWNVDNISHIMENVEQREKKLHAFGNAVVPQVIMKIGNMIRIDDDSK